MPSFYQFVMVMAFVYVYVIFTILTFFSWSVVRERLVIPADATIAQIRV